MLILDLLEQIRGLNTRALGQAIAENSPCHVEPVMRDEYGDVAVEGPFDLPCRLDLVRIEDGKSGYSVMVDPPTSLSFGELALEWNGVPVRLKPFGWDNANVACAFSNEPDWSPLINWFWQHFDPEDENDESDEGLYNVLHYLSDPEFSSGQGTFTVDFGSAQVEAFKAMLHTLLRMGALNVTIG